MQNTNSNAAGSTAGSASGAPEVDDFSDIFEALKGDGLWGSEDGDQAEEKDLDANGSFQPVPLALPTRSAPPLALPGRNIIPLPARAAMNPTHNQSPSTPDLQVDFTNTNPPLPDLPVPSSSQYSGFVDYNAALLNTFNDIPIPQYSAPLPDTSYEIPVPQQQQQDHLVDPALLSLDFTGTGSLNWFYQPPPPNHFNPTAAPSNDIPVPSLSHYPQPQQFFNPADLLLNSNGPGSSNWSFNPCTNQKHYTNTDPTPGAGPPVASTSKLPAASSSRERGRKASQTEQEPQSKRPKQRDPNNPKMRTTPCTWPGCNKMIVPKNLPRHIDGIHRKVKGIKCPFPNCRRKLKWDGDLPRHIELVHNGATPPPQPDQTPSPVGTPPLDGPPAPPGPPPPPPPPPPGASGIVVF